MMFCFCPNILQNLLLVEQKQNIIIHYLLENAHQRHINVHLDAYENTFFAQIDDEEMLIPDGETLNPITRQKTKKTICHLASKRISITTASSPFSTSATRTPGSSWPPTRVPYIPAHPSCPFRLATARLAPSSRASRSSPTTAFLPSSSFKRSTAASIPPRYQGGQARRF